MIDVTSPTQLADIEIAHWFAHVMRPTCNCAVLCRELRAEHGQLTCHACGSPLVPVQPARRRRYRP